MNPTGTFAVYGFLLLYMNFLVEILFLDASSLVDLILGIIDFLELLLVGTANILAQSCYLVGVMLERHLAVGCLHLVVGSVRGDAEDAVGIFQRSGRCG